MMLHTLSDIVVAGAAIVAAVMTFRNSRKIQEVHLSINSRMDQLLHVAGVAARAEGVEQGRNETKSQ